MRFYIQYAVCGEKKCIAGLDPVEGGEKKGRTGSSPGITKPSAERLL